MQQALLEAQKAASAGEVPIGAVLVCGGEIIGRAHNRRETSLNPLDHAEMHLLKQAAANKGDWRLNDCALYVTLEPCPMCLGALFQARVGRLVFGCHDPKRKKAGLFPSLANIPSSHTLRFNNHVLTVEGGVLETACSQILRGFFAGLRRI